MEENSKLSNKVSKTIVLLSIMIAIISVYILLANDLSDKPSANQGGGQNQDIAIGGDFTLIDQNGDIFSSQQMKGKLSLVYFGFTFCPDVCPTSLQKMTEVVTILDKYNIEILPIFITIDPVRDTAQLLKSYLGHFHPKFIGLTGNNEDTKRVADLYKVFYAVAEGQIAENSKYMLDHSSLIYLMDKNGKYIKHFFVSSTAEEIVEYIRINK